MRKYSIFKKGCALAFCILTLIACSFTVSAYNETNGGITLYDDALTITTSNLPYAKVNVPYETQIEATGGTAPYTFRITSNEYSYPKGLTLSTDGKFSGTPKDGGWTYSRIIMEVTDAVGATYQKTLSLSVAAQRVRFEIGGTEYYFDGLPHKVTATPFVDNEDASDYVKNFTVTVGGADEQTNAGSYPIKITVDEPGYIYGSSNSSRMNIYKNNTVRFEFGETLSFPYDGYAKTPSMTATYDPNKDGNRAVFPSLNYSITYQGVDNEYNSSTPPSNPGVYNMVCNVTNSNYDTPLNNTVQFEIEHNKVDFILNDRSPYYYGTTWDREYRPTTEVDGLTYIVKYVKDGQKYDAPHSVGVYRVEISIAGTFADFYEVGTVNPSTVSVLAQGVNFTVSDNTKTYTGGELSPTITNDRNLSEDDYTVTYFTQEGEKLDSKPINAGTYTFTIDLNDDVEYEFGSILPSNVFTILPAEITFSVQNNPLVYDGTEQVPNISASMADGTNVSADKYTVTYSKGDVTGLTGVTDAGVYNVDIVLDDVNYTVSDDSDKTVTVSSKEVTFTVSDNTVDYDKTAHKATITPSDSALTSNDYTVTYSKGSETGLTEVTNAGEYDITVTLNNANYTLAQAVTDKMTVNKKAVSFTVSDNTVDYDKTAHKATITPSDSALTSADYAVTYSKGSETGLTEVTNAGEYDITVTLNNANYTLAQAVTDKMTVNKVAVTFSVVEGSDKVKYDGLAHQIGITADNQLVTTADYTVQYKDSQDALSNNVTEAGEYTVVLTVTNTNFTLAQPFNATMTVIADAFMNYGNSPAAMIYLDPNHKDDTEWQNAALNELETDGKFSNYVPSGCDSSVIYTNITAEGVNLDADPYTCIVIGGIEKFKDPGINVNGEKVEADAPPVSIGNYTYKLTYSSRETVPNPVPKIDVDPKTNKLVVTVDQNVADKYVYSVDNGMTWISQEELQALDTTLGQTLNVKVATKALDVNHVLSDATDIETVTTFTNHIRVFKKGANAEVDTPAAEMYTNTESAADAQAIHDIIGGKPSRFKAYFTATECGSDSAVAYPYTITGDTVLYYTQTSGGGGGGGGSSVSINADKTEFNGTVKANGNTYTRYIVALPAKMGDVNESGTINAADAAKLLSMVRANPQMDADDLVKARIWDVNKDGKCDEDDVMVILERFTTPLVPYYPWIEQ